MGKHCDCRAFGLNLRDWRKLLHVSDAVHDWIDLSFENISMGQLALGAANLNLPTWVEEVWNVWLANILVSRSRFSYLRMGVFGRRGAE
jgi:hypothetical protein